MNIVSPLVAEDRVEERLSLADSTWIPGERYTDRAFFELEKERLWNRVWQMACRLEELPEANDFVEYEINDQSVLIVRQADGSIKAFQNVCMHRATLLAKGAGRFPGGRIVCPFHGWQWSTDGEVGEIYGKEYFPAACMKQDDLHLLEVRNEIWGGCVWINLDPDAAPLMEQLQPMAGLLDAIAVGNMRVKWWKEVILDANWKMAQEAFMEAYHVMQTHPQLTMGLGPNYPANFLEVELFENGHGSTKNRYLDMMYQDLDMVIAGNQLMLDGQDAMFLDRDLHILEGLRKSVRPDETLREAVVRTFRDHNANAGIPMPEGIETQDYWWGADCFLFPNYFILPLYGNALAYRIRPFENNPERCRFEVWSLTTYPDNYPPKRATLAGRYDKEDVEHWGLIPRQDFSNIERQQRGVHAQGFPGMRLSDECEGVIANMHHELDRRLAIP